MPLPPYLRVLFYKSFGVLYGVNFDEIKIKDLNQFRTWNQFFTRELEEGARTIVGENDEKTLVSPCDGKIMRIGQIDSDASSIECVKGNDYRLDEFLLGYKQQGQNSQRTTTERIIDAAKARKNKIGFMVLYLSPKDYHRFHSPANFTASYRRHIAGYLEPVDPRYVARHRDVFKSNERVSILGEWTHGFLAVSFVGATNVGSIKLHFDDQLKTNISNPKQPFVVDKNYAALSEADGAFWKYPVLRKSKGRDKDEKFDIDRYLAEFDIKDVLEVGDTKHF